MALVSDDDPRAEANEATRTSWRRARGGNENATVIDKSVDPLSPSPSIAREAIAPPTEAEIAAEAYAIFEARGGEHGRHEEDWLEAERRLHERSQQGVKT